MFHSWGSDHPCIFSSPNPQFTGDGSYGFCLKIGYPSTHWLIGRSIINAAVLMVVIQHGQSPMWRFPWGYRQIIQVMDGHSVLNVLKHIETYWNPWWLGILHFKKPTISAWPFGDPYIGHFAVGSQIYHRKSRPNFSHMHIFVEG